MAAKSRVSRLESEIEKYRADSNWSKVLDLARQLPAKSSHTSHLETLVKFVNAEGKLERYLLEHPPNEQNNLKAQHDLKDPQRQLQDVLNSSPKPEIMQETHLLLAKMLYSTGDYKGVLSRYDQQGLDKMPLENISLRKLKLIGEAFAIKGLCLEKTPPSTTSKFKMAEREELIIQCFEMAGDISLYQLQERHEKGRKATAVALSGGGQWNLLDSETTGVGPLVETAIQRSPILYIRNGDLARGIGRFRELLQAAETRAVQGLRQTLARQLAEVLMRGVCQTTYEPIPNSTSASSSPRRIAPKKFRGDGLFTPTDENEETLLLLLISESIATKEAVLNRSPEVNEVRRHTFHNTTAVYDLLTIALVKRAQFSMLTETFERSMKFSFDEFHIWYQFGLSLICAEKYTRAFLVLKECMRLQPENPVVPLLAAKLCIENLHMVDEGVEYARQAVEVDANPMQARALLAMGVGYSLKAEEAHLQVSRQDYQKKALNVLYRSLSLDRNDHLALYHVALQMAQLRQIPEAMKQVRKALRIRGDHIHSLHLLALLLSAQKHHSESLDLVNATLLEYPDNFNLLLTRCKLEEVVLGVEDALQTCRKMLKLWKEMFEATLENDQRGTGLIEKITSADHRSLIQLQLTEMSDRDSGSIRAESLAASRVEHTLSEVASSLGSSVPAKPGSQQTWSLQTQIWLTLAELYLSADKIETAQACIQEAGNIFPISHMVSYMRGRLNEKRGDFIEAKNCYENAVSINPSHIKSLQHLGRVLHKLGNDRMAEKILRDAVNVDPSLSEPWHILGKVLESLEDYEAAAECLLAAVELDTSSPIVPFSVLPRPLQ